MGHRAVVLSGGGARGAFQVGALDYLVNGRGLDFDVIAGVSTGALGAIMLAQGQGLDGLKAQLTKLANLYTGLKSNDDIYHKRPLGKVGLLFHSSLYDPTPIKNKIASSVDLAALARSGKELRMGAVCLETGEYRSIKQSDNDILSYALASGSMPVYFPPVEIKGDGKPTHWVDGGVRHVTPLSDAFKALADMSDSTGSEGDDEMFVLLCSKLNVDPANREWNGGLPIAERAVELLVNDVYRSDLAYACAVNKTIRTLRERYASTLSNSAPTRAVILKSGREARYVRLYAVIPDQDYLDTLEFDHKKIMTAIDAGRRLATQPLDQTALERLLQPDSARPALV